MTRRTCVPIGALVASLVSSLRAPVADRTRLTGLWDYELTFMGERRRGATPAAAAADPTDAPVLFTAVQEQLGLEAGRGPVEVLMIQSAAPPAAN